jgi:hypothetical protein
MKNNGIIQSLFVLILFLCITSFFSCGRYLIPPDPKADPPAQEALILLESLANEHTYQRMGFASLEEVSTAVLGTPISVFTVSQDVIKAYQSNMDPTLILTDRHEIIYPVVAGGKIRSSISIMHDGNVWELGEIGRPNFTNILFEVSLLHADSTGNKLEDYFLVNFPSLYVTLVAHQDEDGTTQMALVHGEKSIGLEINQFSSGNEVLAAIAAYAKVHPGGGLNAN